LGPVSPSIHASPQTLFTVFTHARVGHNFETRSATARERSKSLGSYVIMLVLTTTHLGRTITLSLRLSLLRSTNLNLFFVLFLEEPRLSNAAAVPRTISHVFHTEAYAVRVCLVEESELLSPAFPLLLLGISSSVLDTQPCSCWQGPPMERYIYVYVYICMLPSIVPIFYTYIIFASRFLGHPSAPARQTREMVGGTASPLQWSSMVCEYGA